MYININENTNKDARGNINIEKSFTVKGRVPFTEYADDIMKSYFVLCPRGNGLDTHRAWEAYYLDSIPVVEDNYMNRAIFSGEKPVMFVQDMRDVTELSLRTFYKNYITSTLSPEAISALDLSKKRRDYVSSRKSPATYRRRV